MEENQNVEWKESWRDEYLKWICGFANAKGGEIFIGMTDKGDVCGVEGAKRLLEDIPNKIANMLGIVCDVDLLSSGSKEYIRITVPQCSAPISYHGIFHYRSGSTKQELRGVALQDFILRKMGLSWDDTACDYATMDDIDVKAIDYFKKHSIASGRMPHSFIDTNVDELLQNLSLTTPEGKLKNAAILCFGKNPQRFFVSATFKIGRFGQSQSDMMFQDVIDGNILQMTDHVIDLLKSKYLINPIHYEGLQRVEMLEFPEAAIREAIFNAIIHRDQTGAPTQMRVWNDRVELWNDGELPQDFTISMLKEQHSSKPRNKCIANVFFRAGFIESWGRGIDKICDEMKSAGMKEPIFESNSAGLQVTLFRTSVQTDSQPAENLQKTCRKPAENLQKVLDCIVQNPKVSKRQLQDLLSQTRGSIDWAIDQLKFQGYIRRIGPAKGGYWEVITE